MWGEILGSLIRAILPSLIQAGAAALSQPSPPQMPNYSQAPQFNATVPGAAPGPTGQAGGAGATKRPAVPSPGGGPSSGNSPGLVTPSSVDPSRQLFGSTPGAGFGSI